MDKYKVKKAPNTLYYIPNFITDEEEEYLKTQIYNVPKPKWTQLSNRYV
jgi:alkylated DNA repair protein alkB family protein 6